MTEENWYGIFKRCFDRGKTWMAVVSLIINATTMIGVYEMRTNLYFYVFLVTVGTVFAGMLIGFVEIYVLKAYKKEQEKEKEINPIFVELFERLKRIEEKVR